MAFAIAALTTCACGIPSASAQGSLGTAKSFAVLGGAAVTNTGTSSVTGNLGVSPGSAVTGFPPGIVTGTIHVNDAVAQQAQSDAATAYNALAVTACGVDLTGQDLGGLTLVPGVYCFSTSAQLTGTLTLNAEGSASALFIFQVGSTLTTASGSSVSLINGGSACNVFWQVGSSATLGTVTNFSGNILAAASITLTTGASVSGRVLALNGAVTMDTNGIAIPPECQCTTEASVTDLGPGCGTTTAPVLTSTLPLMGTTATLTLTSVLPSAMVTLYASACGGSPIAIPGTPCVVYVDLPTVQMILMDTTNGSGTWTANYGVPSHPSFVGLCLVLQAVVWSEGGPLSGDSLTNGLQIIIGCL